MKIRKYEGYDPDFQNSKKSVSWGVVYENLFIPLIVKNTSKMALFLLLSGTKFRHLDLTSRYNKPNNRIIAVRGLNSLFTSFYHGLRKGRAYYLTNDILVPEY
jgi:hypothetical protein